MNVDIHVVNLGPCLSVSLKLLDFYDFRVYCTDGERGWVANCKKGSLQKCIEMGLAKFRG